MAPKEVSMANNTMANRTVAATDEKTGWTGWVIFAAFLMGIAGIFQIIAGFAALFKDSVYLVGTNQLMVMDYTQWGWTHLLIGILLFFSAFSLANGHLWGMVTLSAVANFVFIQAYPLWSILIILVDILVIYSIAVHAGELRDEA
jgi:hypothetical protein